jgi:hypothetical protein
VLEVVSAYIERGADGYYMLPYFHLFSAFTETISGLFTVYGKHTQKKNTKGGLFKVAIRTRLLQETPGDTAHGVGKLRSQRIAGHWSFQEPGECLREEHGHRRHRGWLEMPQCCKTFRHWRGTAKEAAKAARKSHEPDDIESVRSVIFQPMSH